MLQSAEKKVLILRPDNIGDVVLFSGCLKHIRKLYPDAKITLVVKEHIINLVRLCPDVDEILSCERIYRRLKLSYRFPHSGFFIRIAEKSNRIFSKFKLSQKVRIALLKKRSSGWDVIICPVRFLPKRLLRLVRLAFAKEKIGIIDYQTSLKNNVFRPAEIFSDFMELKENDSWQHELETNRRFVKYLVKRDLTLQEVWPEFWFSREDKSFSKNFGNDTKGHTIGLAVGASASFREWPIEKYGELLNRLLSVKKVVLFGGASETGKANLVQKEIERQRQEIKFVNLAGKTTLRQLAASINVCDLVVSIDTSILHIATSLKIPTVGIMGGGHFERFYPWGDPKINRVVNIAMNCYGCSWFCIYRDYRCIRDISVSMVTKECSVIFEELEKKPSQN